MTRRDDIDIVPATADRFEDAGLLLDAGAERGCWCQAWRGTDAEGRARGETRPDTLRRQMDGTPPRGGVASALLRGVIGAARAAGAPGVEAYPIDPGGRRVDAGFAFTGLASMFDAAGFRRVLVTNATSARLPRLLVRLDLSPGTAAPSGS